MTLKRHLPLFGEPSELHGDSVLGDSKGLLGESSGNKYKTLTELHQSSDAPSYHHSFTYINLHSNDSQMKPCKMYIYTMCQIIRQVTFCHFAPVV